MVKDHSDSEKGNPLPPHRLLFPINTRVLLYAPSHIQDSTYHSLCYTSRGALAGTRRKEMFYLTMHSLRLYGVGHMVKDHSDSEIRNPLPPHELFIPISIIPQTG